jgi:hypothetical protein
MPLVLAIEPDPRQASVLERVVKGQVRADLVLVDSKDAALAALAARIPDVILVTALLPPRDEDEITAYLKTVPRAGHVQTLAIPLLADGDPQPTLGRRLFGPLRRKSGKAATDACAPAMFAEQVQAYLQRAAENRQEEDAQLEPAAEAAVDAPASEPQTVETPGEPLAAAQDREPVVSDEMSFEERLAELDAIAGLPQLPAGPVAELDAEAAITVQPAVELIADGQPEEPVAEVGEEAAPAEPAAEVAAEVAAEAQAPEPVAEAAEAALPEEPSLEVIAEAPAPEPVAEVVVEAKDPGPVADLAEEAQPEEPFADVSAEQPAVEPVADVLIDVQAAGPAEEVVVDAPAAELAVDAPAAELTVDARAAEVAVGAPAEIPATEPADETVQEPTNDDEPYRWLWAGVQPLPSMAVFQAFLADSRENSPVRGYQLQRACDAGAELIAEPAVVEQPVPATAATEEPAAAPNLDTSLWEKLFVALEERFEQEKARVASTEAAAAQQARRHAQSRKVAKRRPRRAEPLPSPVGGATRSASPLDSLRTDIERLLRKKDQRPRPARPEGDADSPNGSSVESREPVARAAQPRVAPRPAAVRKPEARSASQPVEDEWGFYDPEQCGFAALLAKMDAAEAKMREQERDATAQDSGVKDKDEGVRVAPLAVWARAVPPDPADAPVISVDPLGHPPITNPSLRLADDVVAVRYASGCKIGEVRVVERPPEPEEDEDKPVVLLSKKLLKKPR